MKKNLMIIFFCINLINGYSQEDKIYGVYGQCQSIYKCFQMVLLGNGNFKYYINEYVSGKDVVKGNWKINKDTLILNIIMPLPKRTVIITDKGDTDTCRLRFYLANRDTMPISNAEIIINNSVKVLSDMNGIVFCQNPLKQINISYNGMLQDSIFVLDEKSYKGIDFYIPLQVYEPITHQQPTKWLIKGKYLIPFWLKDGKYELIRERAIKKVSKRKLLSELG